MDRLKQFHLFDGLSGTEIRDIAREGTFADFSGGETVIGPGTKGRSVFLLLSGAMRLVATSGSGRRVELDALGPGEIFGERSALGHKPRDSFDVVVAETDSTVLAFPVDALRRCMERYPQFAFNIASSLARKVVKQDGKFLRSEEDKTELAELVRHKDIDAAESYQSLMYTPFFKRHEDEIRRLAESGDSMLITGEDGVGKQQLARIVFRMSHTFTRIFLVANLYSPENLHNETLGRLLTPEELLFGYHDGTEPVPGLVTLAREGTLLVNGIERMPVDAQKRLYEIVATGLMNKSSVVAQPIPRVIACSIPPLGTLRGDGLLYEPLAGYLTGRTVSIPPLRNRRKDIPVLVEFFLRKFSIEMGKTVTVVPQETMRLLLDHTWPGNESELVETIRRGVVLSERGELAPEDIYLDFRRVEDKGKFDLLKIGWIQTAFKSDLFPAVFEWVAAPFFIILVAFLVLGPQDPSSNIGSLFSWSLGWPLMVLGSLYWARFWCSICPMGFAGALAKHVKSFNLPLPHVIKKYSGWVFMLMAISIIWLEIMVDMRENPFLLGLLLLGVTGGAVLFAVIFERQGWCAYLCGLGGMMGFFAKVSPFELRADKNICTAQCTGNECYTGTAGRKGCPFFLFGPAVHSNQNCKICMTCLKNCPHRAISFYLRPPGKELWELEEGTPLGSFFVMAMLGALLCDLLSVQIITSSTSAGFGRFLGVSIAFTALVFGVNGLFFAVSALSSALAGGTAQKHFSLYGQPYLPLTLSGFIALHSYYLFTLGGRLPALMAQYFHIPQLDRLSFSLEPQAVEGIMTAFISAGFLWTCVVLYKLTRRHAGSGFKSVAVSLGHLVLAAALARILIAALQIRFFPS